MHVSRRRLAIISLLASANLGTPAFAQANPQAAAPAAATPAQNDDIIVTAQKREENMQDVPISIQALGTKKLDQLNVTNFAEFSQLLPSVSFQALGGTPGTNVVYMRGVASGGDGNHSGSLPSVGVYLDEQPVTTIGGNLDVHIYDIARIESLSGPQGTLYGASFGGRHDPHHHQQARSQRFLRPRRQRAEHRQQGRCRRQTRRHDQRAADR